MMTQNVTGNTTDRSEIISALWVIHGLQGLVAISANLLTIIAVSRFSYLRDNCACLLIASLGCADFLAGWAVFTEIAQNNISTKSSIFAHLCQIKIYLHHVSLMGNLYNILCVSIERFLYILWPLRYASLVTQVRTSVVIIAIWGIVLTQIGLFKYSIDENYLCIMQERFRGGSFILICQIVIIVFAVILLQAIILRTAVKLRRNEPHISNFGEDRRSQQIERLRQRRMAFMVAIISIVFIFCYIPFTSYIVIVATIHASPKKQFKIILGAHILKIFLFTQSMINPAIYAWRNKNICRAYRKLLCMKPIHVDPLPGVNREIELNQGMNQVAPFPGVIQVAPPSGADQVAPVIQVTPHSGVNHVAPPSGVNEVAPLPGVIQVAPPLGVDHVAPLSSVDHVAPPSGVDHVAPLSGVIQVAPPLGVDHVAPPSGVDQVAPLSGVNQLAPSEV